VNNRKIGVLASGFGSNLQAIMDNIENKGLPVEITVVVSDKADAYALVRAQNAGIRQVAIVRKECADKTEFENKVDAVLRESGVELVVLAGFMRILGSGFVSKWKHRIINIHPALLPSFTGLDAQGQALEYGVKIAGCTVHFVDEGMDTGPIILQKAVPVLDEDTHDTLADRILSQEHLALSEAIELWANNKIEVRGRKVYINK
jgi:phosphoribosylglycinamide formyltransferase 1